MVLDIWVNTTGNDGYFFIYFSMHWEVSFHNLILKYRNWPGKSQNKIFYIIVALLSVNAVKAKQTNKISVKKQLPNFRKQF